MKSQYQRTEMLLGEVSMKKLRRSHVAVFGVGGVGGYAAEALARCGVGRLDLIDSDVISESNINRQIIALHSTVGRLKTEVMAERIHDIDPDILVNCINMFYLPETADKIDICQYDMVIDAVDTVKAKLEIICRCTEAKIPVISSMGTGNKTNPQALRISDIYETSVCPLARVMRTELKKRGIKKLPVLWSDEKPHPSVPLTELPENEKPPEGSGRRSIPGSVSFVPSAAGLIIAGEAVRMLTEKP